MKHNAFVMQSVFFYISIEAGSSWPSWAGSIPSGPRKDIVKGQQAWRWPQLRCLLDGVLASFYVISTQLESARERLSPETNVPP